MILLWEEVGGLAVDKVETGSVTPNKEGNKPESIRWKF